MRQAVLALLGVVAAASLAVVAYQNYKRFHRPLLTTPIQAVMLNNGAQFYGRIDHLGTDHPVLRDAFSVREQPGASGGNPVLVIVRRKDGAHGADHMIIPAASIAWVEPVRADSPVGRLVAQAR